MGTFLSLFIILIIFVIICSVFFYTAVSDAKVREKSALEIYNSIPNSIPDKWIVRYNVGRPQGRFLKMKTFQGSGVLHVRNNEIHFEDVLGNETHTFNMSECKISWVENKINGITNAFKIVDHDKAMFFYVEKGMFFMNSMEENESTAELYAHLKILRKEAKTAG